MKNKILPYVIYGVPIAIGAYFIYKYFKSKSDKKAEEDKKDTNTSTSTTEPSSTTLPRPAKPKSYVNKNSLPFVVGNRSQYVEEIQKKLGLTGKDVDGKFGLDTWDAVVKFQTQKNIKVDGVVGVNTWKALFGQDFPNITSLTTPQQTQTPRQNYVSLPPKETPTIKPSIFDPFNIVKK